MSLRARDEAQTVIGQLADQVGPRRPGSPAEATAAAYLNARLRRAGLRVDTRELRVPAARGSTYAIVAAVGLLGAALAPWQPLAALLIAAWLLLTLLVDGLVAPLPALGPRRPSQDIIANREIDANPDAQSGPRWRVLLLAPLDSPAQRHGLAWLAGPTRGAAWLRLAAMTAPALAALAQLLRPGLGLIAAPAAALAMLPLIVGALGQPAISPGADGGIGALAALVTAVQRLGGLHRVELWAVGVGATASGPDGVDLLARRFPFGQRDTLAIAVQRLDRGQLVYVTRAGALRTRPTDALLLRLASAADADDTTIDAEPRPYLADDGIAAPLARGGVYALTLLSQPDPAAPSTTDPADADLVERAARLIVGIVRRLDEEQRN